MTEQPAIPGFRFVPRTGVIYVMHEATQHGFGYDDPHWANLGQGSPETGPIPGAPPRVESVSIPANTQQYGPVAGNRDLREAVADFYNTTFRKGKKSKYTRDNVSIASGGRVSAAAYVEDVEQDPVIIVDGLTKNWRYPGWRISWTLAPQAVIEAIASAGSFLDGGANHPFQNVAARLLDPQVAIKETTAIQKH